MTGPLTLSMVAVAYPMRGGIAQYSAILAQELARRHRVQMISFTRQYPSFLFPGKTQLETSEEGPHFPSRPMVDSVNPWSWLRAASAIADSKPDGLLYKYWMPFFAPAFGTIARRVKARCGDKKPRTIMIVDNLIPHERRPFDLALTRWLMGTTDAYIVQSGTVREDLLKLDPKARYLEVPHPVYNLFGERVPKTEARERLGLETKRPWLLFFGFVRAYKGLDLLIRALSEVRGRWAEVADRAAGSVAGPGVESVADPTTDSVAEPAAESVAGPAVESVAHPADDPGAQSAAGYPLRRSAWPRLMVLGEFYGGREEIGRLIKELHLEEEIILRDEYVPNEKVGLYFSAADVVVLPYRSATQSGIVQIAYQLERPVISTDVGGLAEVILDGETGFVVPPQDVGALTDAILRFYAQDREAGFVRGVRREREKYSWDRMTEAVETLVREG